MAFGHRTLELDIEVVYAGRVRKPCLFQLIVLQFLLSALDFATERLPKRPGRSYPIASLSPLRSTAVSRSPLQKWLRSAKQEPRNPFSWDFRDYFFPKSLVRQGFGVDT